jgi:hypothetical protein
MAQGNCGALVQLCRAAAVHSMLILPPRRCVHWNVCLCRNLTITGLHGKDVVLDLEFKRALVELCSTCTLTFSNITISNERWGTGSVYDLFLGLPGSKIIADDIYKLRIACTSANHLAQVTSRTKRSSILPGSNKPQDFEFVNITFMVSGRRRLIWRLLRLTAAVQFPQCKSSR